MQVNDARRKLMALMECGDYSSAATLLDEINFAYPEAGARLSAEVAEAYPRHTL